jgi:hypothetical protein
MLILVLSLFDPVKFASVNLAIRPEPVGVTKKFFQSKKLFCYDWVMGGSLDRTAIVFVPNWTF